MGDGKKWAAEQEEIEAQVKADKAYSARLVNVSLKMSKTSNADRLVRLADDAKELVRELDLGNKTLKYDDHVRARKLASALSEMGALLQ